MKPGEARVREEASAVDGLSSSGLPGQIDVHPPRMAAHPALVHLSCSVVLFLNLAGLVIAIAGIGKLTDMCRKREVPDVLFADLIVTDNRDYDCGMAYSFEWWIVSLQSFLIAVAFLGTVFDCLCNRTFVMHVMAVASTLFCIFAYEYVKLSYVFRTDSNSNFGQAAKAASAGAIMVLTTNFIFAALISTSPEPGCVSNAKI